MIKNRVKNGLLMMFFLGFAFFGLSKNAAARIFLTCNGTGSNSAVQKQCDEAYYNCGVDSSGNPTCVSRSSTSEGFSTSMLNPNEGGISVPDSATTMIKNIITLVFVIAAVITFAYLVYGAISWITSGGDKSKVEAARNRITSAVIGLLILAATWAIFLLVMQIAFGSSEISIPSLGN